METRILYVTVGNVEEARLIARTMVEERLVACANLLPPVESFFWWEGKVQSEPETVLILKTTEEKTSEATERIKALHSYSCPCVIALPVVGGNVDFLDWIKAETSEKKP